MAKKEIKDESNPQDDAKLPRRQRTRSQDTGPNDFSVTNRTGAQRHGHPDGWQTGGRDENG